MDNETLALTEDVETEAMDEVSDAELEAFESGWDDIDSPAWPAEAEPEDDGEDQIDEAEADDSAAGEPSDPDQEETDDSSDESEEETGEPKGETEGEEGEGRDQTFTLRHLGEDREVSRDEVIQLAQQGLDYPRIREKWDGVKDKVQGWKAMEAFLAELAEGMGGDINRLIDETRTRVLMERAEAEGKTISAAEAARQAVQLRLQQQAPAEAKGPSGTETGAEEERSDGTGLSEGAIQKFLALYGADAPASQDIPQSVWDEAMRTGDLIGPYQKYQINLLKKENEKLKNAEKREQLNRKNAERSAGSVKSAGAGTGKDPFDEGWDSADW